MKKTFLIWTTLMVGTGDFSPLFDGARLVGKVDIEGDWDAADGAFMVSPRITQVVSNRDIQLSRMLWPLLPSSWSAPKTKISMDEGTFYLKTFKIWDSLVSLSGFYDSRDDTINFTVVGRPDPRRRIISDGASSFFIEGEGLCQRKRSIIQRLKNFIR